jgi:hypothetical protein
VCGMMDPVVTGKRIPPELAERRCLSFRSLLDSKEDVRYLHVLSFSVFLRKRILASWACGARLVCSAVLKMTRT